MSAHYAFVAERAAHRCEYCRAPEVIFSLRFEVDHVIPLSRGGQDAVDNLALSCRSCNLWKGSRREGEDPEAGILSPLFNPRSDDWSRHFEIRISVFAPDEMLLDSEIAGLTAVGRATVAALRMNSTAQITARRWWMSMGLFP